MYRAKKRKTSHFANGSKGSLQAKVNAFGGETGFALELEATNAFDDVEQRNDESGVYGSRRLKSNSSSLRRMRQIRSRTNNTINRTNNDDARSSTKSSVSVTSRFTRASSRTSALPEQRSATAAVHIVCALSENLARETCVASMDAGSPISMNVTKQANGQTYAETLAYLEVLKPDEILLNEGRRHSQLARKVLELFPESAEFINQRQRHMEDDDLPDTDHRYGQMDNSTVVKFISRAYFDQTKGAELLMKVAREETYDATMVEEYILLSSAHAVLHYIQQCLGATFMKQSIQLMINAGGNNRMIIDRATLLQLELLVNAKTGKVKNSLIGTIDSTKTTVGSRLLRSNLMSPPARVDTINTRLELVDLFLSNAEFFYAVLDHLTQLPDVDKMLSNIVLIPKKLRRNASDIDGNIINERTASKGISALVCIKTTLQALPSFAAVLQKHLQAIMSNHQNDGIGEDGTVATDRSSLLVGLGGGVHQVHLYRHHLLQAIIYAMTQPALTTVLEAVTNTFTETTTFARNSNAMRHQECFALKCEEDCMMSVIRKAYLANVDDIYKKADSYAEIYGLTVSVRYSTSRGYYLSVPADIGSELPVIFVQPAKSGSFINCTTEEITSLNTRAQDNVHDLLLMTHDRIQEVMSVARQHYDVLATLCDSVALLDMCHSFADNVMTQSTGTMKWCRPDVSDRRAAVDDSNTASVQSSQQAGMMVIRKGRYPIDVSDTLPAGNELSEFVPNDTFASDDKTFTVITGINGSGKSTYLKQIAMITILAHCGSYVTAESAKIPIRDRVCCRIGNTDDQEHNISTFLLEMKEAAYICNNSTQRSLVLIDELGRATSNEDGVAIAWSMSEYLLKRRAMTFFVTHYPQLSSLASIYPKVQNIHLQASISHGPDGEISYTHRAMPGACSVSQNYGVKLAAVCGWPIEVINNASNILDVVEGLLPEESLCHQRPIQHLSNTRTNGYNVLTTICSELQDLLQDDRVQSIESIRNDLVRIHETYVKKADQELIIAMEQLLFSNREKGQAQSPKKQEDHHLEDDSVQYNDTSFTIESRNDHDNDNHDNYGPFESRNPSSHSVTNDRRVTATTNEVDKEVVCSDDSSIHSSSSSSSDSSTSTTSSSSPINSN